MKRIFEIIKELRQKNNRTQAQIAEYLDIDTSAYGKLERGTTDITFTKIEKLAELYNLSVVDFISYPQKFICINSVNNVEVEEKVTLTIELKKEKKEQVLKLVFGDNNVEISNK
jgi:transcriptional regulator with XRE-family HTH domain